MLPLMLNMYNMRLGEAGAPLKDRIGSEIRTHYPLTVEQGLSITRQESWVERASPIRLEVPNYIREIVEQLDLLKPIYQRTAAYGHFGRTDKDFGWERTDRKDALRSAAGGTLRVVNG